MSDVARHQLRIALVPGTWGRGFFPTRQRPDRPPFWWEENSPFLARLSTELGDIPHKISPLLWSGSNSISARDETARALAERLSAEYVDHSQATQLIIAHSHGDNIALRALHRLQQPDPSRPEEGPDPFVVTLATPFVEVHQADFGDRPSHIRYAVISAIALLLFFSTKVIFPDVGEDLGPTLIFLAVVGAPFGIVSWYWFNPRATARRLCKTEALRERTRLSELPSAQAQRVLIIRAIDDEASLILAVSTVVNYITSWSIMYLHKISYLLPLILILVLP